MKRTKKILLAMLATLTAGFCALGVACGETESSATGEEGNTVWTMQTVYAKAQELGYTGSLEEFIATVSGKDGVGIKNIYINENGELIVQLTVGEPQNLGVVVGKDGKDATDTVENAQELEFYPLDDGTYGVKAGKASYLSEITIPATYKGKKVSVVLDYFFGVTMLKTKKVIISDGIEKIAERAFEDLDGYSSLTSVEIPDSVTSIGSYAFLYCSSLTSIKYCGTQAQWEAISKGYGWDSSTGSYTITYNYQG